MGPGYRDIVSWSSHIVSTRSRQGRLVPPWLVPERHETKTTPTSAASTRTFDMQDTPSRLTTESNRKTYPPPTWFIAARA